ncbi:MAG TPA: hypothetical protein VH639_30040 [Bryobacteraceae bacterium]|jgi:hypothetical protein
MNFNETPLSRRGWLAAIAGTAAMGNATRLLAASDFWNKKDPKDWTNDEIEKLTTNSPWAKPVSAQMESNDDSVYNSGSPQGGSQGRPRIGLGIPGLGIPGVGGGYPGGGGGGYPGGGGRRGSGAHQVRGTVLWESAQPVMDAVKPEFPEEFAGHLVIALNGFPFPPRNENRSEEDALDDLKSVTFLKPDRSDSVQPGVVKRPVSSSTSGGILFGFSKDLVKLGVEDKEIQFTTSLGHSHIVARFTPKDMLYRGKLAV